ncbi:MAG TPA: DNA repair protein RecO [Salinivirgaceae bacterium]|nr:DNA repair protein RecO [Salinivirgaceae bacterium]
MEKTLAIVIDVINYSDNQSILQVFSDQLGRTSFIYSGGQKRIKQHKTIQPLYQVEILYHPNSKSSIKRATSINLWRPYTDIPTNHRKIFISLFISEILSKTIVENTPNPTLFSFCSDALLLFDRTKSHWESFHLSFIVHLMKHLGIFPQPSMLSTDATLSALLSQIFHGSVTDFSKISCSRAERNQLLAIILEHYATYLPIGEIKSHKILQQF